MLFKAAAFAMDLLRQLRARFAVVARRDVQEIARGELETGRDHRKVLRNSNRSPSMRTAARGPMNSAADLPPQLWRQRDRARGASKKGERRPRPPSPGHRWREGRPPGCIAAICASPGGRCGVSNKACAGVAGPRPNSARGAVTSAVLCARARALVPPRDVRPRTSGGRGAF